MRVMKRKMQVCIGLAIIVLCGVTWFLFTAYSVTTSEDILSKRVIQCLEDSGNNRMTSKFLNDDLWDELWIISPYVEIDRLGRILPLRAKRAVERTGIQYRDDFCALVFLLNNGDYQICVEKRYPVDFATYSSDVIKCKPDAQMCFKQTGEARPRLVLETIIHGGTTGKSR